MGKIGIIYYSITGNTRLVAQKLFNSFVIKNLDVQLLEIKTTSNDTKQTHVEFVEKPAVVDFDTLIIGSPVHGFMPSVAVKQYLEELDDLSNKKVILFVTHYFPFAWMGGNSSLKNMERLVLRKNGLVVQKFSINWTSRKRNASIETFLNTVLV
jgi:flavodoxin